MRRKDELPTDKPVIFVCAVGQRSALACEVAASLGFTNIYNLEGGTDGWIKAGKPVER
jgi:rhodanese-related sulfurtransferase